MIILVPVMMPVASDSRNKTASATSFGSRTNPKVHEGLVINSVNKPIALRVTDYVITDFGITHRRIV